MIYTAAPTGFNPKFEASGCFIEAKQKFPLLHRQDSCSQGNTWGLPSGKIKPGESPLECMAREIKEETGLIIPPPKIISISQVYVRYPDCDFKYHIFHTTLDRQRKIIINPQEHKDFKWVSPEEALALPLILDLNWCIKHIYQTRTH